MKDFASKCLEHCQNSSTLQPIFNSHKPASLCKWQQQQQNTKYITKKKKEEKNTFRLLLSGDHLGFNCELAIAYWDPGYPG